MKKLLTLVLCTVLGLSLCACGDKSKEEEQIDLDAYMEMIEQINDNQEESKTQEEKQEEVKEESKEEVKEEVKEETKEEYVDGMRIEFKEAMDAYEAFYDEYCEFLKDYMDNPDDFTLLLKYGEMVDKAAKMDDKFNQWNEEELNDQELKYYLEVSNRITNKLLEVQ